MGKGPAWTGPGVLASPPGLDDALLLSVVRPEELLLLGGEVRHPAAPFDDPHRRAQLGIGVPERSRRPGWRGHLSALDHGSLRCRGLLDAGPVAMEPVQRAGDRAEAALVGGWEGAGTTPAPGGVLGVWVGREVVVDVIHNLVIAVAGAPVYAFLPDNPAVASANSWTRCRRSA